MFAYEAAILLKDIACPFCEKRVRPDMGSPFRTFNAMELTGDCDGKKCNAFYKELNTQFQAYDAGQIGEPDLQSWLDNFRK
jgi:hypothetical protein